MVYSFWGDKMKNVVENYPQGILNRIGFSGKPYDFKNKTIANMLYLMQYFNRTLNMFEWTGLEDVKKPYNELFQQMNGYSVLLKCNDTYYLTPCTFGGECDVYYLPKYVIVANPWANDIEGFNGKHTINEDCVLLKNDSTMCGLFPLINRYTTMLVENDISLFNCDILSRIVALLSVNDDKSKPEADRYIKAIIKGDFAVFAGKSFYDDMNLQAQPISNTSSSIMQELIEFEQYIKGALSHELGINYSFNMKREALNTAESELNNQYLIPLIDDMLLCRKQFCENVKNVFGLDVEVKLSSVWLNNQMENEAETEINEDMAEDAETSTDGETNNEAETSEEAETEDNDEPGTKTDNETEGEQNDED